PVCDNYGLVGSYFRKSILPALKKLAPADIAVLIQGEPGTGKELVAESLHKLSGRSGGFAVFNCSAIPEGLFESELFGHIRGSFTGATANVEGKVKMAQDGTLFFDEIGDLPLLLQPKLLRLIQNGEAPKVGAMTTRKIKTRVVSATNKNLKELVDAKLFRQDLYDRLAGHTIKIVPLRERLYDLSALIDYFMDYFCATYGKNKGDMAGIASSLLAQGAEHYSWPGNVRELRNFIENCVIFGRNVRIPSDDSIIIVDDIVASSEKCGDFSVESLDFYLETARLQKYLLRRVLEETGGNKRRAADILGITEATLYRWLKG
ncbi:MAG: sigma 54-interacting transcriptional regulator, partial [Candidatus Moranbacteria bacterium]|nr:sigma 54-interacting transcriptional regulator [Candidatus Moranbacteria bacterium]